MENPPLGPRATSDNAGTNGQVPPFAPGAAASEPVDTALAEPETSGAPTADTLTMDAETTDTMTNDTTTADTATADALRADTAPADGAGSILGRVRWPAWLRELILVAAVYFTYSISRNLIPGQVEQAQHNARTILDAEKALGLDIELGINLWGADRTWLIIPANYYYATLHLSLTLIVMIWLYRRRKAVYARCRSVLLTMTMMALASYWLYPLAPPRLMTGASYVDTVKEHVLWGFTPSESMKSLSNQYAAMPSMHVGWALWVGLALALYARTRLVRALGIAYPIVTVFVVMVTGNHFILDAVAAVAFFAVAVLLVDWFRRLTGRMPPPAADVDVRA